LLKVIPACPESADITL